MKRGKTNRMKGDFWMEFMLVVLVIVIIAIILYFSIKFLGWKPPWPDIGVG